MSGGGEGSGATGGRAPRGRRALLVLCGGAIAFVGAVCGIGGGLFAVPLLHYGFGLALRASVATSLCLVAATALASTGAELVHAEGALLWDVVLPLVAGALVGAQFGYLASRRLPERAVKGLFAVVMLLAGLRLFLDTAIHPAPTDYHPSYGLVRVSGVATIGILAGTVSPLLGIGGGLIVIPSLLLALPEVGGLGARAASLGVACVTSLRSIQLYLRERAVDLGVAPWFVLGAVLGAVLGVQAVHHEGVAAAGRRFLGVLMVLTAWRFARDVRRGAVSSPPQ